MTAINPETINLNDLIDLVSDHRDKLQGNEPSENTADFLDAISVLATHIANRIMAQTYTDNEAIQNTYNDYKEISLPEALTTLATF